MPFENHKQKQDFDVNDYIRLEELSNEEIEKNLEYFEALENDFKQIANTFENQIETWCKKKAGGRLPLLKISQEETIRCLDDLDPNIREVAIYLAIAHWKAPHLIVDLCERMAIKDSSIDVRCRAISALGNIYQGLQDNRIGGILARIVSDPQFTFEERKNAYLSLVRIEGIDHALMVPNIILYFPKIIDWELVNRYLATKPGTTIG